MPLIYHTGQIAVQEEAGTRVVADRLAHWVGPVAEFAVGADLILLATLGHTGALEFTVLSGSPPLVEVAGPGTLRLAFPPGSAPRTGDAVACGGLAIHLGQARRARINGTLRKAAGGWELDAAETFTLCRKHMAPSLAIEGVAHAGPVSREPLALDDPWLAALLARTETSFLASISPDGGPDVAHRGGPPGFLSLDAAARRLAWPEYLGDGVFKSAGNVRATGTMTLLVVDLDTGDGAELVGRGDYTNVRTERRRVEPLVQHRDPFPVQGTMACDVSHALRLRGLMLPRRRIERAIKVTSRSPVHDQAPR